ncbi:nucleotide sugar dehydrogenase [uncultured Friedmanniella sp.]|uniref:nucleotide sugar dehydrogenase n=1 Tax=uncultured Friedmanniella sp. TaxID=335381 RepID=UPI0035C9F95E
MPASAGVTRDPAGSTAPDATTTESPTSEARSPESGVAPRPTSGPAGPDAKVVIVGQGYVGLPVAMRAVEVGYTVVGVDVDDRRIGRLAEGASYVDDVDSARLQQALDSGRYLPTTDYQHCEGFDYAVITVPTPLRESVPDLSFIESAAASLAPQLRSGATVILESTTYPGTTEELLAPLLESISGLTCGTDFYVGYSPERIDPGNQRWGFVETPKVVSGIGEEAYIRIHGFYSSMINEVVGVSGTKEAELTKLLENTFRHVNIALVNELLVFGHQLGVDVWEAIDAAGTKPFGFMKFTPGPGVGGHCLPVDPSYLSWEVRRKLGRSFRFVELANDINDHMPDYVVSRIVTALNRRRVALNGSTILLVGLAYKRNTGDVRESPALRIVALLREYGVNVQGVDHHVEPYQWPAGVESVSLTEEVVQNSDYIVLLTDHDDVDYAVLEKAADRVFDTRHRVKNAGELL